MMLVDVVGGGLIVMIWLLVVVSDVMLCVV